MFNGVEAISDNLSAGPHLCWSELTSDQTSMRFEAESMENKIIPSQMEVAPLHCTVDITQKRRLFKNTKEIEKIGIVRRR